LREDAIHDFPGQIWGLIGTKLELRSGEFHARQPPTPKEIHFARNVHWNCGFRDDPHAAPIVVWLNIGHSVEARRDLRHSLYISDR
jgi:hypothetical protein